MGMQRVRWFTFSIGCGPLNIPGSSIQDSMMKLILLFVCLLSTASFSNGSRLVSISERGCERVSNMARGLLNNCNGSYCDTLKMINEQLPTICGYGTETAEKVVRMLSTCVVNPVPNPACYFRVFQRIQEELRNIRGIASNSG